MIQTPDEQKLSHGKAFWIGLKRIASNWRRILKKALPCILAIACAVVTTFGVLLVWEEISDPHITKDEILALQDSKTELEQALAESEQLLNQMAANNKAMSALLDQAEQEEGEMAQAIRKLQDAYTMLNQKWYVPIQYTAITSAFGLRTHPVEGQSKFHSGMDLAAPLGVPVLATRGGTITIAKYDEEAGYFVEVDHLDGYTSRYLHLARYIVAKGQMVIPGQVIGYCGSTGMSTGSHLHFAIYLNGEAVNPADYMEF